MANGTYSRLASADLSGLDFGTGFNPDGSPSLLDHNKPVYRYTDSEGAVWYAWARMGSGYHISKLSDTSEWYWEGSATNSFASSLLGVETAGNSWVLSDAPASVVVTDQVSHTWAQGSATVADWASGALVSINTSSLADPDGLGILSYQWQQSVDGSTNWTNITDATSTSLTLPDGLTGRYLRVQIRYTDLKGRNETFLTQATQVTDNRPPRLDLNSESSGNHHQVNISTNGEAVAVSSKPSVAESATINKVVIGINSNDVALTTGEQLSLIGLSFNLDGTNLPASFDVGSVTWTPSYEAITRSLVFTASGAGATASSIQAMGSNMQYVNTSAPSGNRVLSFSVFDASGNQSNTANTTITFDQAGPEIDLNAVTEGSGHAQTLTDAAIARGGVLLGATASVQDNSALASLRVSVSGLVDGDNELITLGSTEFKANGTGLPSTVSDGTHTWVLAHSNGVFTFTQAAGNFAALDAQALLQALGFKNTATTPSDGVRVFDISATDQHGLVAEAARSRVAINLALPTVAASNALVTLDADGDGIKGDVFTIRFSEPIEASRVSNTANWTLSGGATLGTGATIEAISPITIDGVAYAAQFRVTGGTGRTYTTGTTFTITPDNVVDSTGGLATSSAVFTMSDIVAPSRVSPPESIGSDNTINASETLVDIPFTFTASADNHRVRFFVNGVELSGKALNLAPDATAATLTMSMSDWGGDGTKTIYARLEDAAGNLGSVGIAKSVIVDTSANTAIQAAVSSDTGTLGVSAGDVLSLNFDDAVIVTSLSAQFGTGATFTAVGGTPAPGTSTPFYSKTWTVTLGTSPSPTLAGSDTVTMGVRDVGGNTGTVTTTLSPSLYDLPGQAHIRSVTSDNVLTTAELSQAVTVDLTAAKVGDTVRLYLDGQLVGTQTLSSADSSTAFNLSASDWGGDGERVLTATIQRGDTVVNSDFKRSVYVNADGAHWSVANGANTAIWFDPDTLSQVNGSQVASWNASVGGSVATQATATRQPKLLAGTVNGHNQLFFDGGGNLTNPAAANIDFLVFNDPNNVTGTARAERNVAMFAAGSAQSSAFGSGLARVILNLGYFAGNGSLLDARSGAFSLGTENNANSLAGTGRTTSGSVTVGQNLSNTTSSGVYFTEAFRYTASNNTYTLLANDQKLSATSPNDTFLNTTDANAGQGNPLMIGAANYGNYLYLSGAGAWYGNVGDVITLVTPNAVTDNQMLEIQTYTAAKYRTAGVQVAQRNTEGAYDLSNSKLADLLFDNLTILNTAVSNDVVITAGADYVNAGAGDDQVHIKDLAFRHLDGGTGADTLLLHADYVGSGSIVLADMVSNARGNSGDSVANARVNAAGWHKLYGFETIDLSTSAAKQTLTVAAADVNQLSETNTLGVILGDNDVLNVSGFTAVNPQWGYYTVGSQIYTQKYVDSTGAYTLYAIGGNSQPQVSGASYSGNVLTLNFNESLTSSAALGDWSVAGGASTINSLAQSSTGNNTLSFTMSSLTANSVVRLTYTGTALTDTDGKALRFKEVWVSNGANDTLDASAVSTGVALFGNGGADVLTGGAGSDKLVGGQGNDTLTGGAGADTFAFIKGELSQDTITDFSKTQGDKLDLSLLLDGAGMDKSSQESINKFLQLTQSGNDAVLKISVTGSGDFSFADQTITMTNAWASGGMNEDISTLLNNRIILA